MIVSKANLQAIQIAKKDRGTPALYVVYLDKDGTTTTLSQSAIVSVSPVKKQTKEKLSHFNETSLDSQIVVSGEMVDDVLKNIPRDTLFKGILEHCDIDDACKVTLHDGKRNKVISGRRVNMKAMPYKEIVSRALNNKQNVKSAVNLSRLRALLDTIAHVCGDQSGELPLYIEFSDQNDLIIRSFHPRFGQRVLGIMMTYKGAEGKWLPEDDWEKDLRKTKNARKKIKTKLI